MTDMGRSVGRPTRVTHGRHCTCSACAQEDWTNPELAPCGMRGPSCPREYQPIGPAGTALAVPANRAQVEPLWTVRHTVRLPKEP
jgi:hypothetical protein